MGDHREHDRQHDDGKEPDHDDQDADDARHIGQAARDAGEHARGLRRLHVLHMEVDVARDLLRGITVLHLDHDRRNGVVGVYAVKRFEPDLLRILDDLPDRVHVGVHRRVEARPGLLQLGHRRAGGVEKSQGAAGGDRQLRAHDHIARAQRVRVGFPDPGLDGEVFFRIKTDDLHGHRTAARARRGEVELGGALFDALGRADLFIIRLLHAEHAGDPLQEDRLELPVHAGLVGDDHDVRPEPRLIAPQAVLQTGDDHGPRKDGKCQERGDQDHGRRPHRPPPHIFDSKCSLKFHMLPYRSSFAAGLPDAEPAVPHRRRIGPGEELPDLDPGRADVPAGQGFPASLENPFAVGARHLLPLGGVDAAVIPVQALLLDGFYIVVHQFEIDLGPIPQLHRLGQKLLQPAKLLEALLDLLPGAVPVRVHLAFAVLRPAALAV